MSESPSSTESPSGGSRKKYRDSEAPTSSAPQPPSASKSKASSHQNNENIAQAKELLKTSEDFLIAKLADHNLQSQEDVVKKVLIAIIMENEDNLIKTPTHATILASYEKFYKTLPQAQDDSSTYKIILKGMEEQVANEKINKSKLKYW